VHRVEVHGQDLSGGYRWFLTQVNIQPQCDTHHDRSDDQGFERASERVRRIDLRQMRSWPGDFR